MVKGMGLMGNSSDNEILQGILCAVNKLVEISEKNSADIKKLLMIQASLDSYVGDIKDDVEKIKSKK